MTLYDLMRRYVWARDKGVCRLCGAEGHDVHHIKHQGPYPHMRYDLDNVLLLCVHCHDLDNKGHLVPAIKRHIGEDKYWALNRRAQAVHKLDTHAIRFDLTAALAALED